MMIPQTLVALDYEELKQLVAERTQTPLGRARALSLHPSTDPREVIRELTLTSECVRYFARQASFGLAGLADPSESLRLLRVEGSCLDPGRILDLLSLIEAGQRLRASLQGWRNDYPHLARLAGEIPDLRPLLRALGGKILPSGEMDDHASPALAEIRREIHHLRGRIYRHLERILREAPPGMVQDEIVTLRNERYVIPLRATHRGQIPGVVHAVSSSGATVFVEPLATVELNNELVRLLEMEQREIARILLEMSDRLRVELPQVEKVARLVGEIDLIGARARLSLDFDGVEPTIVGDEYRLSLTEVRHLLLDRLLRQRGERAVPLSVDLDDRSRVLIISGPNAGGKTVALKTVGLACLMAQSGLHVPARQATLSIFRAILADIGDQQSIAANLSTFTAHITSVKEMAETMELPALVLLDEVGTGTDPDEGAALAIAIVDYFRRRGALVLAATHYPSLKMYASLTPGVVNAAVEFDDVRLQPTYRLVTGLPGASNGMEIARRIGLPDEILDHARRHLAGAREEADRYLRYLKAECERQHAVRRALEEQRHAMAERSAALEDAFRRREQARQQDLRRHIERLTHLAHEYIQEAIRQLIERRPVGDPKKAAERRIARLVSRLSQESRSISFETPPPEESRSFIPALEAEISVGDHVRVRDIDTVGTIVHIAGEQVEVQVGSWRMKTNLANLDVVAQPAPPPPERPEDASRDVIVHVKRRRSLQPELDLRGKSVEEALEVTDRFLDDACLASLETVRIIHGVGSGALRQAIREMLEGHPHVASFRPAEPHEGSDGVTLVFLKRL